MGSSPEIPSGGDRRGASREEAVFRAAIDRIIEVVETLGGNAPEAVIVEVRTITRTVQGLLAGAPALDHKMRNIATIATLEAVVTPAEAVAMIKDIARFPPH